MVNRFFIVFLIATSCTPKAISYLNEEVKFQHFNTYRLLNTKLERTNLSKKGRSNLDFLEFSIREKMKERGYLETNLSPDLILRYEIVANRQTGTNTISRSISRSISSPVSSKTTGESIILLDLTDAQHKKIFWQSSYNLKQQQKKFKKKQAIEDAISEIFYSFPYRAGQKTIDPQLADWSAGRKAIKAKRKEKKKQTKSNKK